MYFFAEILRAKQFDKKNTQRILTAEINDKTRITFIRKPYIRNRMP